MASASVGAGPARSSASAGTFGHWWRELRQPLPRISLALQGGGAHGAFTWGVLDTLLAEPRVRFDGLSGSSAGAMNAVVLASGWLDRGRDGARQALDDFWTAVGKMMPMGMVTQSGSDGISLSQAGNLLTSWAAYFSPSQLNPLDINPLRELISSQVDFDRLRAASPFRLFIGATHANTGKLRVFREGELTPETLLASACLPRIHHAVEIDGEAYWDGGYSANPAVYPLLYDCDARDVLLVLLSPLQRDDTPRTVEEINARVDDIAFSAHFLREMGAFSRAMDYSRTAPFAMGRLERRLQRMRFHMIDASRLTILERSETKLLAHPALLQRLREQGQARATSWLDEHFNGVGRHSTLDVKKCFG